MKNKLIHYQKYALFFLLFLGLSSCIIPPANQSLVFKDYQNLKIGFSTQNFQKAMPVNAENLTLLIEYATKEGYQFIEIRDDLAKLSEGDCKILATVAKKNRIELIYEIHKNLLDTGYIKVFEKGLANTLLLPGPGILRTLISKSEFDSDPNKKGWNKKELNRLAKLSDSCAFIAKEKNIQFVVENLNESFFGHDSTYYGLTDFFGKTTLTGLQFDISNPFRSSSREKADPGKVIKYLSTMGNRWVISHLKTISTMGGEPQPILTDNPLSVEKVVEQMGKMNIPYVTLELAAVADMQQCFDNQATSIEFLKEKGLLKNQK